jgi:Lon protease-like protein
MIEFFEKQIAAANRILEVMTEDHKFRTEQMILWTDMSESLMHKLEERDKEIERLRGIVRAYETAEKI